MLDKFKKWTPTTLEQVIEASNRLINAAAEDIFYANVKVCEEKLIKWFKNLTGKIIYWDNGIKPEVEYLYITEVNTPCHTRHNFYLSGIRLSKVNRIGPDCLSTFTLTIDLNDITAINQNKCAIWRNGRRVDYVICSNVQYMTTVSTMKDLAEKIMKIPDKMTESNKLTPRPKLKLSIKRKPSKCKD